MGVYYHVMNMNVKTGERRGDEPESGKPLDTAESRIFGTPEYFEMKTYWHRQYTNQKVRDMVTQSPVTYTFQECSTPVHATWGASPWCLVRCEQL